MKKTNVPGSQSFGQKLLQFIRNNTVPIMFILICAYCIPQAGFSWSYLLNEVMTRLGRNAFLILSLLIPVMAGRNLAVILETAAINNRQKEMGYNAAQELLNRLGLQNDVSGF